MAQMSCWALSLSTKNMNLFPTAVTTVCPLNTETTLTVFSIRGTFRLNYVTTMKFCLGNLCYFAR